jgi:tRNA U34 5-methylaminomethyl-2-thiouridine-forming methyltransferase MnmC
VGYEGKNKNLYRLLDTLDWNIFIPGQGIGSRDNKERDVRRYHQLLSFKLNPLTPNDLQRRRAVSPLKIKIPGKNMRENQQMQQLLIQFINY